MNWPNEMQGTSLLAAWCNRLRRMCIQENIIEGTDYKIERVAGGKILKIRTGGGTSAPPSQAVKYTFKQSFGDYFLTYEGTSIAKPTKLRNSILSEVIYNTTVNYTYPHNVANDALAYIYRTATVPSVGSENQGIVPLYLNHDAIWAVQVSTGVVSVAADTSQPAGTAIGWLDLNIDGRAWSRFANQTF